MSAVTQAQAEEVLRQVAHWLGTAHGMGEPGQPAPTGSQAAAQGLGPQLVMDWDWTGRPTPTIILEGGPYDWAAEAGTFVNVLGIYTEPYSGWALSIYSTEA